MEFKLNKIDTDIRKKINEERKETKVHHGKGINVKKDLNDENNKKTDKDKEKSKEQKQKRFITIDGIKNSNEKIKIEAEKNERNDIQTLKGRILDIRK